MEYLWRLFLHRTETLCSCYGYYKVPWYVHCDISMATQWFPGPLHSKGKIRVFLLQEVLFARVVHSVGVSRYGHHAAQVQESPLDSGAEIRHFSFWEGRSLLRVCCYGDIITTITMCSSCSTSTLQNFNPVDSVFTQIFHILLFYSTLCPHRDVTSHVICINPKHVSCDQENKSDNMV